MVVIFGFVHTKYSVINYINSGIYQYVNYAALGQKKVQETPLAEIKSVIYRSFIFHMCSKSVFVMSR